MRLHPTARTVILVEDDPTTALILSEMLKRLGFETIHYLSANQALLSLKRMTSVDCMAVCLIISDISMPGLDGIGFGNWIKHQPGLSTKPFLFSSGEIDPETVARALKLGTAGYLVKPISFSRLKEKLEIIFPNPVAV